MIDSSRFSTRARASEEARSRSRASREPAARARLAAARRRERTDASANDGAREDLAREREALACADDDGRSRRARNEGRDRRERLLSDKGAEFDWL